MEKKISPQNYDLILKEAFSIFKNKSLDFLGLNLPPIVGLIETEFAEVETHNDRLDLVFLLEDKGLFHLEEETDLSERDLVRFAHYDLRLYERYRTPIHTVVVTPSHGSPGTKVLDSGVFQYTVTQVVLSNWDGDALSTKIQSALELGKPINELELIFLPLMKSCLPVDEVLKRTIQLEKMLPDKEISTRIQELTLVLSDRLVDDKILDELWEELCMLKVIKYAENRGRKEGIIEGKIEGLEEGIEKGIEKGMEKGQIKVLKRQLTRKFGSLSPEISKAIDNLDEHEIVILSIELINMKTLEDLLKIIKV
jgi:hypothetical protein